eukprot:4862028-Pyramimonas_sp.AAC.1
MFYRSSTVGCTGCTNPRVQFNFQYLLAHPLHLISPVTSTRAERRGDVRNGEESLRAGDRPLPQRGLAPPPGGGQPNGGWQRGEGCFLERGPGAGGRPIGAQTRHRV